MSDATTNQNVEEGLLLKTEALFALVLTADACTSVVAFNATFAKLFIGVTGSNDNVQIQRHGMKITLLKILELLPQEIEP